MTDISDSKNIRFYVCLNCTRKQSNHTTSLTPPSSASITNLFSRWTCSCCGNQFEYFRQRPHTTIPEKLVLKTYDENPTYYFKEWFVDRQYGYFENSPIKEMKT